MKRIYTAAALAALCLSACSTPELEMPNSPENAMLGFKSVITAGLTTRADGDVALAQSFKFNLGVSGEYEAKNAQMAEYDGGTFSLTSPINIFKYCTHKLTAWAPADITAKATETPDLFTLTPGVSAVDFLYATPVDVTVDNAATLGLSMKHAMAKLTFKIVFPEGYEEAKSISLLTVNGTPGASDFDIATGAWATPFGADSPVDVIKDSPVVSTSNDMVVGTTIVVPKPAATLKVDCTIDGHAYTGVAIADMTSVDMATDYIITLTVSKQGLGFSSVTTEGWKNGTGSGSL